MALPWKIAIYLAAGTLDLVIATTVVEVGIDVPGATLMVIEGAEHFERVVEVDRQQAVAVEFSMDESTTVRDMVNQLEGAVATAVILVMYASPRWGARRPDVRSTMRMPSSGPPAI